MIILKENGICYLSISAYSFLSDGVADADYPMIEENMPAWKVPNDDNIVVAIEGCDLLADLLRYDPDFIRGELSVNKIVKDVMPKIIKVLKKYGKLRQDGDMNACIGFAQRDKAFMLTYTFDSDEIESARAFGPLSNFINPILHLAKDLDPKQRLITTTKIMCDAGYYNGPRMCVIDTETYKPYIIE